MARNEEGKSPKGARQVKETIRDGILQKMKDETASTTAPAQAAPPRVAAATDDAALIGATHTVRKKIDTQAVSIFLRQMSILLGAGIPLSRCLQILLNRTRQPEFRDVLSQVMQDVEKGEQLWIAMGRWPQVFNAMVVNIIRTGEESGSLVRVTNYLAEYRDREEEMLRSVQKSVSYPLFLLILAIVVVLILITTVIPIFAEQYTAANIELPWPTKVLIGISGIMTNFWLVAVLVVVLGYLVYRRANQRGGLKPWLDRFRLALPIFGRVLTNIYTVQFASMMSILMRAGLPMMRTLELVKKTMTNTQFNEAFADIKNHVERGRTLEEAFSRHSVFPPLVHDLVTVGEETGTMPDVLEQVANIYQKEVDHETAIMGTLLEPVLIVTLGLIIGFVALAMFMPYFNMVGVVFAGTP